MMATGFEILFKLLFHFFFCRGAGGGCWSFDQLKLRLETPAAGVESKIVYCQENMVMIPVKNTKILNLSNKRCSRPAMPQKLDRELRKMAQKTNAEKKKLRRRKFSRVAEIYT